jgi:RNA polymerase sigma-70 factor, ECF subfamily
LLSYASSIPHTGKIAPSSSVSDTKLSRARPLAELAQSEFQFIWRSLRRLGVYPDDQVDDAAQRVFEVATVKWQNVEPGKERAYLYRIAVLVAAEKRRARRTGRREEPDEFTVNATPSNSDSPENALLTQQYRAYLDYVLEQLSPDLREVFVLFELERMSSVEISDLLNISVGTVASRLRRARESFQKNVERLRKKLDFAGEFL